MWKVEKFLEILHSPIRITRNGRELGGPFKPGRTVFVWYPVASDMFKHCNMVVKPDWKKNPNKSTGWKSLVNQGFLLRDSSWKVYDYLARRNPSKLQKLLLFHIWEIPPQQVAGTSRTHIHKHVRDSCYRIHRSIRHLVILENKSVFWKLISYSISEADWLAQYSGFCWLSFYRNLMKGNSQWAKHVYAVYSNKHVKCYYMCINALGLQSMS